MWLKKVCSPLSEPRLVPLGLRRARVVPGHTVTLQIWRASRRCFPKLFTATLGHGAVGELGCEPQGGGTVAPGRHLQSFHVSPLPPRLSSEGSISASCRPTLRVAELEACRAPAGVDVIRTSPSVCPGSRRPPGRALARDFCLTETEATFMGL